MQLETHACDAEQTQVEVDPPSIFRRETARGGSVCPPLPSLYTHIYAFATLASLFLGLSLSQITFDEFRKALKEWLESESGACEYCRRASEARMVSRGASQSCGCSLRLLLPLMKRRPPPLPTTTTTCFCRRRQRYCSRHCGPEARSAYLANLDARVSRMSS